jgi:hypothetical protein
MKESITGQAEYISPLKAFLLIGLVATCGLLGGIYGPVYFPIKHVAALSNVPQCFTIKTPEGKLFKAIDFKPQKTGETFFWSTSWATSPAVILTGAYTVLPGRSSCTDLP